LLHLVPQAPQLLMSDEVCASQPSLGSALQSAKLAWQVSPHLPAAQTAAPWGPDLHTVPQAPQFLMSVAEGVSQPVSSLPSQSEKPSLQLCRVQMLPVQTTVALEGLGQEAPQAPQLRASDLVSMQEPAQQVLPLAPLQSALLVQVSVQAKELPEVAQCSGLTQLSPAPGRQGTHWLPPTLQRGVLPPQSESLLQVPLALVQPAASRPTTETSNAARICIIAFSPVK